MQKTPNLTLETLSHDQKAFGTQHFPSLIVEHGILKVLVSAGLIQAYMTNRGHRLRVNPIVIPHFEISEFIGFCRNVRMSQTFFNRHGPVGTLEDTLLILLHSS